MKLEADTSLVILTESRDIEVVEYLEVLSSVTCFPYTNFLGRNLVGFSGLQLQQCGRFMSVSASFLLAAAQKDQS